MFPHNFWLPARCRYWSAVVHRVCVYSRHVCTLFTIVQNDVVFMRNNEDFTKQGAIRFIPARDGNFGRVAVRFHNTFGRREEFAQGSMNKKRPDPTKETQTTCCGALWMNVLPVRKPLNILKTIHCPHPSHSQFILAASSGASVVVSWLSGKELFPENTRSFRLVLDRGQGSFQADKDVRITGFTLHKHEDIRASRIQNKMNPRN